MSDIPLKYALVSNDRLLDEISTQIFNQVSLTRKTDKKVNQIYLENERLAIKFIINSLYQGFYSFPKSLVSLSLRAKDYSKSKFSYRALRRVFEALISLNLISFRKGTEASSKVTRIWPTKKLYIEFKKIGLVWRKYLIDNQETIIVRKKNLDGKKVIIKTPNTEKAKVIRENIYFLNSTLSEHCIALDIDDEAYVKLEIELKKHYQRRFFGYFKEFTPTSINYARFKLYRVFSDEELTLHGRFYGGWWQLLPEKFRQHITIDTLPTIEADYSTLSLRMIYALEKETIPKNKDLFDLGLNSSKEQRKIIKKFTYAIINDEKGRFRLSKENLKLLNITHEKLFSLIQQHHPIIKKYLGSKIGLQLMNYDSNIAEDIMINLYRKNIIVLPIHDSFIVALKFKNELLNQMISSYKKYLGQTPEYDVSSLKIRTDIYDSFNQTKSQKELKKQESLDILLGKKSKIYHNFVTGWIHWNSRKSLMIKTKN